MSSFASKIASLLTDCACLLASSNILDDSSSAEAIFASAEDFLMKYPANRATAVVINIMIPNTQISIVIYFTP